MLEDRGYLWCEVCFRSRGFYKLHCHHIMYRSEVPGHPMLHDKRNLIICCDSCHDQFHAIKSSRDKIVEKRGLKELFYGPDTERQEDEEN
jgi:hypothetical protein